IIDDCYGRARAVLTENKDVLDRIAHALLEREALESEELDTLIAGRALPPEVPVVAPPVPAATQEVKSFPRPETSIPPKLKPAPTASPSSTRRTGTGPMTPSSRCGDCTPWRGRGEPRSHPTWRPDPATS